MDTKTNKKLTDFDNFWKIITLVSIAVIAEGVILWAAASDMAVEWTYDTVIAPRVIAQETQETIEGDLPQMVNE